jgi:hypothetical protein
MEPTPLGVQVSEPLRTLEEQASSEAVEEVQTLEAFLRTHQAYLWERRHHLAVKEVHQLEGELEEGREEPQMQSVSKLRGQEGGSPLTPSPDLKAKHSLVREEVKLVLLYKGVFRLKLNSRCMVKLKAIGNLKVKDAKLLIRLSSLNTSNHRNRLKELVAAKQEMSPGP